jgi:hypothetical protein
VFSIIVIPRHTIVPQEGEKPVVIPFKAPLALNCNLAAVFSSR